MFQWNYEYSGELCFALIDFFSSFLSGCAAFLRSLLHIRIHVETHTWIMKTHSVCVCVCVQRRMGKHRSAKLFILWRKKIPQGEKIDENSCNFLFLSWWLLLLLLLYLPPFPHSFLLAWKHEKLYFELCRVNEWIYLNDF